MAQSFLASFFIITVVLLCATNIGNTVSTTANVSTIVNSSNESFYSETLTHNMSTQIGSATPVLQSSPLHDCVNCTASQANSSSLPFVAVTMSVPATHFTTMFSTTASTANASSVVSGIEANSSLAASHSNNTTAPLLSTSMSLNQSSYHSLPGSVASISASTDQFNRSSVVGESTAAVTSISLPQSGSTDQSLFTPTLSTAQAPNSTYNTSFSPNNATVYETGMSSSSTLVSPSSLLSVGSESSTEASTLLLNETTVLVASVNLTTMAMSTASDIQPTQQTANTLYNSSVTLNETSDSVAITASASQENASLSPTDFILSTQNATQSSHVQDSTQPTSVSLPVSSFADNTAAVSSINTESTTSDATSVISPSPAMTSSNQLLTSTVAVLPATVTSKYSASVRVTEDENGTAAVFTSDLQNKTSTAFRNLAKLFERNMDGLFSATPGYQRCDVTGFRNGSVIVDFSLVIEESGAAASSGATLDVMHTVISDAIRNSSFGMGADPASLTITVVTCPPSYCANNGTCYTTGTVAICKCSKGYHGQKCEFKEDHNDESKETLLIALVISIGAMACLALLCAALASRRAFTKASRSSQLPSNGHVRYDNLGFQNGEQPVRAKVKQQPRSPPNELKAYGNGEDIHESKKMTSF